MRYKDTAGDEIVIPPEQLAYHASDNMLLLTAVLAFVISIVFIVGGRLGKQMWIWVWGIGLMLSSIYLWVSIFFGIKLFGAF